MSIEHKIIVKCDGPKCGYRRTFDTESEFQANILAEGSGWLAHEHCRSNAIHGEKLHFCCGHCRKNALLELAKGNQ